MNRWSCLLFFVLAVLASPGLHAQFSADPEAHTRTGDRHFMRMAYAPAMEEYRIAAEMGATNEHVVKRLAECYMKLGDTENAEKWYAQVVQFLNRQPMDLFNYAQALKGNAKYDEAERWMDQYLEVARPENQSLHSNIGEFAKKFTRTLDRFTVKNAGINSAVCDMAAAWHGTNEVYFSSSREKSTGIKRVAAWNEQPFLDVYRADRTADGALSNPRRLQGDVNGSTHEGPVCCSANGDALWFTRNNRTRGKNGVMRLTIQRASMRNGGWHLSQSFQLNNPEISVGHPALSADGRTLIFVSDMPGGQGGTDLYACKDIGGTWSEPVNLGPAVNSPQNEGFPFLAADGALYFASNGLPGLGGFDIFMSQRDQDGKFNLAMNVGAPVNGPKDDFAFIIDAQNKNGYFTSNRPGGMGDDDIYSFVMHAPLEQQFLCTGTVIDEETGDPMPEVDVFLQDVEGTVVGSEQTDMNGRYSFQVEKDKEYRVVAKAPGRYDGDQYVSTESIERVQIMARDIHLVPDAGIWLRGHVRNKGVLGYVEGVTVSTVNLTSLQTEVHATGPGGDFSFRMQPNETYEVLLEKTGYYSISVPVSTSGMKQGVIDLNQAADLSIEPILVGKPVTLKHQKWEFGNATLDNRAKAELDVLAARLMVNPQLQVELAVHSDTRGDATKELKLSQERADAIVKYLRAKGVAKDHIVGIGQGVKKPMNRCGPGVNCTEEEHAMNRRVEYTVTAILAQ